jgi:hypothetical protein
MAPEGLNAATIRPRPRIAAAAEPWVPTCSSTEEKDVTSTVPAAPPTRPMPIRSIPTVRITLLMAAAL